MKICSRCSNVVQDNEEFCGRCGSTTFTQQASGQGQNQGQRPMNQGQGQGQQMGQRPMNMGQGQRPMGPQGQGQRPMNQGQRPMGPQGQGQPVRPQRPMNQGQGQQMGQGQRPMGPQGQGQRPMNQNQQMGQQMGQGQQMGNWQQNGYGQPQNQQPMGGFEDQNMFPDTPPEKKKGLFSKKPKQPKQPKQPQNQQQIGGQQNGYDMQGQEPYGDGFMANPPVATGDDCSVKDWVITYLTLAIPILNLIVLFKGALKGQSLSGADLPLYKVNFFKAYFIFLVIMLVVSFVLSAAMGTMIVGLLS